MSAAPDIQVAAGAAGLFPGHAERLPSAVQRRTGGLASVGESLELLSNPVADIK
jgi:hypothetical protein